MRRYALRGGIPLGLCFLVLAVLRFLFGTGVLR